jgi:hypothetical protein
MSGTRARGPLVFPLIGDLVNQVPGGRKYAWIAAATLIVLLVGLITAGIVRSRRYAAWAPIDVVESRDPLQDLPIRVAGSNGAVAPARTYDAMLDLSSIASIVIGVDLDYIPRGAARYDVTVQAEDGDVCFQDTIAPDYFKEGRFMLRLFSHRFRPGAYLLEIMAYDAGDNGRVVGASWFQLTK